MVGEVGCLIAGSTGSRTEVLLAICVADGTLSGTSSGCRYHECWCVSYEYLVCHYQSLRQLGMNMSYHNGSD